MSEVSISRKEGTEREGQIHSTAVLKTFIKEMTLHPKSLILDLGCICDSNIELFTHLGCKVFVKDLLNANVRARTNPDGVGEISVDEIQIDCEYSENFFDGILLWDILDHFDFEGARLLVNNARRILKEKGWALALFRPPVPTTFNTMMRYRIRSLDKIRYETLPLITPRNKIYYNRDITDLFGNFTSYSSYMIKNRWREAIVRK
ncbi:MAG: methyltransferase domain-containing protein [Thermodesulfobacteriota bacterium]